MLLDIMLDDSFVCQLDYKGGSPIMIDGKLYTDYTEEELIAFVEKKRPSLKGKPFHIAFSNSRII